MKSPKSWFVCFVTWFVLMLAGCEQWDPAHHQSAALAANEESDMSMSPVTAADYGGSLPVASISCPDAGEKVKAEDIRAPVAALLAEADDIRNNAVSGLANKVNRTGDTMTGKLTINNATSNQEALEVTGNGSGAGLIATGGATGYGALFTGGLNKYGLISTGGGTGAGVRGVGDAGSSARGGEFAASGNAQGVHATGLGSGAGVECIGGASAPGLIAASGTAGTLTVPQEGIRSTGFIRVFGAQPNSNVDPGEDNALHGTNIVKAWATVSSALAVLDGYNIASITLFAPNEYRVTFVREMANVNYGVKINVHGAPGYAGSHNGVKTKTHFHFNIWKTDTLALGFGAATEAYIEVMGRQ